MAVDGGARAVDVVAVGVPEVVACANVVEKLMEELTLVKFVSPKLRVIVVVAVVVADVIGADADVEVEFFVVVGVVTFEEFPVEVAIIVVVEVVVVVVDGFVVVVVVVVVVVGGTGVGGDPGAAVVSNDP